MPSKQKKEKKGQKTRKNPQLPSLEARFSSLITSLNSSSPVTRQEGNYFKLGTEVSTRNSMTPLPMDFRPGSGNWNNCSKERRDSPTIQDG
jgi:hypothetical protein